MRGGEENAVTPPECERLLNTSFFKGQSLDNLKNKVTVTFHVYCMILYAKMPFLLGRTTVEYVPKDCRNILNKTFCVT